MTAAFCVNAEGITPELSKELVNLYPGQAFRLTLTDNQYEKIFTSSDTSVASVNNDGLIFAKNTGVTEITCKLSTKKELKCTVKVKEGTSPTEVKLDKQIITLKKGEKETLDVKILPVSGRNYKYFSSSDETVAEVDDKGNITAKKPGSAVITVESESTAVNSSCFVRVLEENDNNFTTNVAGVIYNAAGEKLANTQAGITGEGIDKKFTTNEDGQFRLNGIVKGDYILTVYSAGTSEGVSAGVTISSESVKLSCILTDKALCQDHVQVILIDRRVLRVFLLLFPHEPLKAGSVPLIFEGNQLAHEPDRLCFVISAHGVHELVHFHVHVFQHPQEPRERNIGLSALEPRDLRLGNMLIRNLLQGDVPVGPEIMEYSAQLINVLHILSQSPRLQGVKGPLGLRDLWGSLSHGVSHLVVA